MTISREVLLKEVQSARDILQKWSESLDGNVPRYDVPGSDEDFQRFMGELMAELLLVSGKCDTIAAILKNE